MTARAGRTVGAIGALIADDEELARARIRALLSDRSTVQVVGESASGPATLAAIRSLAPELLFLDVQMPGLNGFEVLARLTVTERPAVVFSTAYDEYAIEAFEVNAVDYLLKPYADERFDESLRRAERAIRSGAAPFAEDGLRSLLDEAVAGARPDENGPALPQEGAVGVTEPARYLDRFAIPVRDHWVMAPTDAVDWIEAAGDYVNLHVEGRSYLLRGTMASIEARLDPRFFLRIHRSTIVRADRVRRVEVGTHGDWLVLMRGGEALRVSRGYRDDVLARLGVRW